jgi:hypothetical protein
MPYLLSYAGESTKRKINMVKFGYFDGPQDQRHDVFLHRQLCQPIPEDLWEMALPHATINGKASMGFLFMPNREFINWLTANEIEYRIHSVWFDGCSLYLVNHTDAILAFVKISWDSKYCRT